MRLPWQKVGPEDLYWTIPQSIVKMIWDDPGLHEKHPILFWSS